MWNPGGLLPGWGCSLPRAAGGYARRSASGVGAGGLAEGGPLAALYARSAPAQSSVPRQDTAYAVMQAASGLHTRLKPCLSCRWPRRSDRPRRVHAALLRRRMESHRGCAASGAAALPLEPAQPGGAHGGARGCRAGAALAGPLPPAVDAFVGGCTSSPAAAGKQLGGSLQAALSVKVAGSCALLQHTPPTPHAPLPPSLAARVRHGRPDKALPQCRPPCLGFPFPAPTLATPCSVRVSRAAGLGGVDRGAGARAGQPGGLS